MSPDAIGALVACFGLLAALLGFVWRAAVTATSHDKRLEHLEESHQAVDRRHDKLDEAIDRLTRAVYQLRGALGIVEERANMRSSQHEIDESEPPKGLR